MHNASVREFETDFQAILAQSSTGESAKPIVVLLESTLTKTNAHGAYLYQLGEGNTGELVAAVGLPASARALPLPVPEITLREHVIRAHPIVIQDEAWQDRRFVAFPEFQRNHFEGVVSIAIVEGKQTIGVLNVCRSERSLLKPIDLAYLTSLSAPLGALMAAENANRSLRSQVDKLTQQLASRKLIERAKGLLQTRFDWTEEEAYFYVRRTSRQRRIPMSDVALEVIDREGLRLGRSGVGFGD